MLTAAPPVHGGADEQELRGQLAALGAPLGGPAPKSRHLRAEEVLAQGLVLAHHSPTVARVLPVAFWRQRETLDYERLERAATQRDERQALGFYLELTGQLGGDRRLARRAGGLRDRRRTALRPDFSAGRGPLALPRPREVSGSRSALGLPDEHGARELRHGLPQARPGRRVRDYVRAEIEPFLRAVDRALERRATAIVIGGGAAALKYRIDDPTTDIDTFNALGADLRRAIEAARKATG
ncbi:MAG: hypothetical protein AB7O37_20550 [Vicinamibacteria bacterium]